MRTIPLTLAKPGHKSKVAEILGGAQLQKKLLHMGVYKGREVSKMSHIGLRGPVVIKVGRGLLALGHDVAAKVIVEHP